MNTNGTHRVQAGFTLVELMVALLLGLLVIGAAGSLFLSNRRVYGSTEAVNRIQENQRTAFELMARDIREAGGNPCTRNVVNMLDVSKPSGSYWTSWGNGVSGTEGTGGAPDSITLSLANGASIAVTSNDDPSANIGVASTAGLSTGDILMVCNAEVAAIFQVTGLPSGSIQHNSGSGDPGNLEKPFQLDQKTFDSNPSGNASGYCYLPNTASPNPNCLNQPSNSPTQVIKPVAVRWYLASNGRGGTSLYRQEIGNGGKSVQTPGEIAEGVTDMQIAYKIDGANSFVAATAVAPDQWKQVIAVSLVLTVEAVSGAMSNSDTRGTGGAVMARSLTDVITLRNHVSVQ